MATDLLTRIKQSAVLCDGAMGTLLYGKGIFINRCYDELNVSQPELIRGIHHDYLQAGAEIIETNTFGGNSFRLARHSMASQVREINVAGARLAREAAKSFDVWVAGSVGPLGVRIEPLGKTSFEEARIAFREQIEALVEGGVDLLMLETFGYLEELHQAVLAARDVNPKIPVVAHVTIDEDGVWSKFGVAPASIPDWLALVGDSADGFPGILGWGKKSASEVLAHYDHLDQIPDDVADWDEAVRRSVRSSPKLAARLAEDRELANLFLDLATLRIDTDLLGGIEELAWTGPTDAFADVCHQLGADNIAGRAASLAKRQ